MANIILPDKNYIVIPQLGRTAISQEEVKFGKDFYDSFDLLKGKRKLMPPIPAFMTYFLNTKDAARGEGVLERVSGRKVGKDEAENIWNRLSSAYENIHCTWLNGYCIRNKRGELVIQVVNRIKQNNTFVGHTYSIPKEMPQNCFVDLSHLGLSGFSNVRSRAQYYSQGENLYQGSLIENFVARLGAYSVGVFLGCGWDPAVSDASRGVFALAQNF